MSTLTSCVARAVVAPKAAAKRSVAAEKAAKPSPALPEPLEYFTAIVHQNRIVVIGDRSPLILDETAGVWVHDPDVVPPLPWVPPDKPLYAAMTASVPVG